MKVIVKRILKELIPSSVRTKLRKRQAFYNQIHNKLPQYRMFDIIRRTRIVSFDILHDYMEDYVRQLIEIFQNIQIDTDTYYVYPYDPFVVRLLNRTNIASITVDFSKVLNSDIGSLLKELSNCKDTNFRLRESNVIAAIADLGDRVKRKLQSTHSTRAKELSLLFPKILYRKPDNLDEAIQKLLFYDALFWQMGHSHIGLGRLDAILIEYYEKDVSSGKLAEHDAREKIRQMLLILNKDTSTKSLGLLGDTGQYILLGGKWKDGNIVENRLTALFLELMTELKIPDPKLILRVNPQTSKDIWLKAVSCIMTGIGSPLIMDENLIMSKMINFGYDPADVWNMGTSACWEPLVIGKSFDQNNPFRSVVAIKPLNDLILSGKDFSTFDSLLTAYKKGYEIEIKNVVKDIKFDCSPLFSLFFDDCIVKEKDFSAGGATYSYHGAQVVGFPNTINALLNLKHLVYEEKTITLTDCKRALEDNFSDMEDLRELLISSGKKFGLVDNDVIGLTNELIDFTETVLKPLRCNGEVVKIGFSSPNYIEQSKTFDASLDGRRKGEPFAVHISPSSSKIDISEILEFSSRLLFNSSCINGNVVDFILPVSYIKQPEKLVGILRNACSKGVFELQLNVLDKNTLIDAKAHPEKYPNLIVRVWGFSAYFNDLPEEYKNNLIHRAGIYEAT